MIAVAKKKKRVDSEVLNGRVKRREAAWFRALAEAEGVTTSAYVTKVLRDHLRACGRFWNEELERFWMMVERATPPATLQLPADFKRWPRSRRRAWLREKQVRKEFADEREAHNGDHE